MTRYVITTEVDADSLTEAWQVSSMGHPVTFQPGQDWGCFKSFRIETEDGSHSIELIVTNEKENN